MVELSAGERGGPRRAAVLGSPVPHSLSPLLHRAAYAALGLDGWTYDAIEVDERGLPGLSRAWTARWAGLSLTMPLKQAVLPLLDHVEETTCASPGPATPSPGRRVGAWREHRRGGDRPRARRGRPGPAQLPHAHVLGGGATAASAVLALLRLGCRTPVVHVRDPARAGPVLAAADRCGVTVDVQPWPTTPGLAAALAGGRRRRRDDPGRVDGRRGRGAAGQGDRHAPRRRLRPVAGPAGRRLVAGRGSGGSGEPHAAAPGGGAGAAHDRAPATGVRHAGGARRGATRDSAPDVKRRHRGHRSLSP